MTDLDKARNIVIAYESLLAKAIEIVSAPPWRSFMHDTKHVSLSFDGDDAVVRWVYEDFDYYESTTTISTGESRFPIAVLTMRYEDIADLRTKLIAEENDRKNHLIKAQVEATRNRVEQRERSEFARLSKKFVGGK